MGGLSALCCSKKDKNDGAQDTPSRPAQQRPENGTQSVPIEVRNGTFSSTDVATDKSAQRDLWKEAFDGLDPSRKQYLPANGLATKDSIQKVIDDTTARYEEWQKGGLKIHRKTGNDINLRDSTEKIISRAMKFQQIVSKGVSFDPTGHASSAWTVISFGMSIVQNRLDRRDAIFAASDYLAETLAYYALVDENYRNQGVANDKDLDEVLLRVYSAILDFTAQVKKDQEENEACRTWNSILALTDQPLGELKSSIETHGQTVQKWSILAANLGDRKRAEAHLARTDEAIDISRNIETRIISMEEERQLDWMSVAPYSRRQAALQDKRTGDTGIWFLDSKEYNDWKANPGDILWLQGIMGCGKSVLCSTVIRDLEEICRLDPSKVFAYWYFDFGVNATQNVDALSRSLIRQLSWSPLASSITDLWKENHYRGSQPDSEAILAVLDDILSRISSQVYLVFDALDECPEKASSKERGSLLALLVGLLERHRNKVHILATSRPEEDISQALGKFSNVDLEDSLAKDVKRYVTASISRHLNKWDEEIKKLIFDTLTNSKERRFLWAELQIIELQKCRSEAAIKKTLQEVPQSLEEAYRRILDSIEPKDLPLAQDILTLICLSPVSLHVKTVADMLDIKFPEDLVKICTTSLVAVFDNRIRAAHFSVQEFLIVSEKGSDHHECQFSATSGHKRLAELAIDCLLAQTKLLADAKKRPWFLYASKYWITHLVATRSIDQAKIERLFTQRNVYQNWVHGASRREEFGTEKFHLEAWLKISPRFGPPIHTASVLGFVDTVDSLVARGADPLKNERDGGYPYANLNSLNAAAKAGQLDVVQSLLQKDLRLDQRITGSILEHIDHGKAGKAKLVMILETLRRQGLLYEQSTDAGDTLSESVIKAAMANSESSVEIMSVFLNWRPEVSLPSTELLLKYALGSLRSSGRLLRLFVEKFHVHLSPALIHDIQEGNILARIEGLDFLAVELPDELPMTERLVLEFARYGRLDTMKSLLQSRRKHVHVTQRVLDVATASSASADMLPLLWPYREPGTEVSESMLISAIKGGDLMDFVSQQLLPGLTLAEKAILDIIEGAGDGVATIKMFLSHPSLGFCVSEDLIETICSHRDALGMLKLLPKDGGLGVPITETMVCTAARNWWNGPSVLRYLAEILPGPLKTPEKALLDVIENTEDDEGLKILIQDVPDTILTEQVFLAACTSATAMRVMLDQKRQELPIERMLLRFVNEPQCSTDALRVLLERDLVKIDEHLVKSFTQSPRCLDVLLSWKPDAPITEEVLMLAASDPRSMRSVMIAQGESLAITEDVLVATIEALSHPTSIEANFASPDVMDLIVTHQGRLPITKRVIRAACSFTSSDRYFLIFLLCQEPVSFVRELWQETWTEVDFNPAGKIIVLMAFLLKSSSNITDAMLEDWPSDLVEGRLDDVVQGLCGHRFLPGFIEMLRENDFLPQLPTTERATEIIVERCGKKTIETFLDCNQITVTDKIMQAAERNKVADIEELMALLEQKKCI